MNLAQAQAATETCEHCHFHEPEGDHLFLKIVTFLTVG